MSPQATTLRLEDFVFIEKRLRSITKSQEFTRLQAQLNSIERSARDSGALVQAQFYLMSGALKIKAVSLGEHQWLQPEPILILQESLELLQRAQAACGYAVEEAGGWTIRLSQFQQACAYEACVATSHIISMGSQPDLVFDTSRLDNRQHRNYLNALRHKLRLRSSF